MFIKLKKRVFVRFIGSSNICYIQNRATNTDIMFGGSAKEFIKCLSDKPLDESFVIDKICETFNSTDRNIIENDAKEFLKILSM